MTLKEKAPPINKFLPSYVGSKKYWVNILRPKYEGQDFVELFCGSAVLSANLAKTAILNDLDPYVFKILSQYDKLIVPKFFTKEDYFIVRKQPDWWKYVYCLQKMSFSGVFRYSGNGYNVPVKPNIPQVAIQEDYKQSLGRWKALAPTVLNMSYEQIDPELFKGKVVVSDPPYETSQASYNTKHFNYKDYWEYIERIKNVCSTLIVFDRQQNFINRDIPVIKTRPMRVNGGRPGDFEALSIYEYGEWVSASS